MEFVRKVKTGSGGTAVQICRSRYTKVEVMEHLGTGHTPREVEKLEKKAREIIAREQGSLFKLSRFDKPAEE